MSVRTVSAAGSKKFIESIWSGTTINNADAAVESNLTAILGRTAAYQESPVTWDQMMTCSECWEVNFELRW